MNPRAKAAFRRAFSSISKSAVSFRTQSLESDWVCSPSVALFRRASAAKNCQQTRTRQLPFQRCGLIWESGVSD
jgi:hypothetical protein